MAVGTIMPLPRFTGFDANVDPVAGGQLFTFIAGTSTPVATYSDVGLTVAHANPILLNSAGRPASGGSELGVYLTPGSSYKFVLQDAHGATIWTQDNVAAVPSSSLSVDVVGTAGQTLAANTVCYLSDGTGGRTAGFWYLTDSTVAAQSTQPRQIGVAMATIAAGSQGAIRIEGALSIPGAGFTPGATYYVHSVPGALSGSVAQTFLRAVGVAQDVTTLIIGAAVGGVQPVGITFTTTLTGTQHNLPIPAGCSVLYCGGGAPLTLTGIAAGTPGQDLTIVNLSAAQVDLLNFNSGSSLANRFSNLASGPTSLAANGSARYLYDAAATLWRLQDHEQGAWIDIPFNAALFAAAAGGTWTVTAGQVNSFVYLLRGKTLTLALQIGTSTLTGTALTLNVTLPAGFTVARTTTGNAFLAVAGVYENGITEAVASAATLVSVYRSTVSNFAAGTVRLEFTLALIVT
jgi:hypothetical protein